MRSTKEVFEDHLRLALGGDLETDLKRNYSEDITLLTRASESSTAMTAYARPGSS